MRRLLANGALALDPPSEDERIALSSGLLHQSGEPSWPLNGLRERRWADMSGWFIWAGDEFPRGDRAWKSLHVSHVPELLPDVLSYLALPEGWRFLIAPDHEDIWFDGELLEPSPE